MISAANSDESRRTAKSATRAERVSSTSDTAYFLIGVGPAVSVSRAGCNLADPAWDAADEVLPEEWPVTQLPAAGRRDRSREQGEGRFRHPYPSACGVDRGPATSANAPCRR